MMNIPPSEAKALALWEYEALLHHWNKTHGGGDEVQAPDHERTQKLMDKINADPRLTGAKSKALN